MKGRQIILDHLQGREAAALIVDGKLQDFLIDTDITRPGTIYRAIADRPVKGQGGMFLKTPDGNVFLRQVKGLSPGQSLMVQVTGHAEDGKAIPVTQKLLFKSRFAIITPGSPGINVSRSIRDDDLRDTLKAIAHDIMDDTSLGLILRSSCALANPADIAEDIANMQDIAKNILADPDGPAEKLVEGDGPHVQAWREWTDPAEIVTAPDGFENYGVLDALDQLASARVSLGSGAFLIIEPTCALVAVDVNTGADTAPAAALRANLACAKELPRQLRLRGLGGQVTIDVAPMPKKDRRRFESALRAALKADGIETVMAGWTPLGHFELQRKRERVPLTEALK